MSEYSHIHGDDEVRVQFRDESSSTFERSPVIAENMIPKCCKTGTETDLVIFFNLGKLSFKLYSQNFNVKIYFGENLAHCYGLFNTKLLYIDSLEVVASPEEKAKMKNSSFALFVRTPKLKAGLYDVKIIFETVESSVSVIQQESFEVFTASDGYDDEGISLRRLLINSSYEPSLKSSSIPVGLGKKKQRKEDSHLYFEDWFDIDQVVYGSSFLSVRLILPDSELLTSQLQENKNVHEFEVFQQLGKEKRISKPMKSSLYEKDPRIMWVKIEIPFFDGLGKVDLRIRIDVKKDDKPLFSLQGFSPRAYSYPRSLDNSLYISKEVMRSPFLVNPDTIPVSKATLEKERQNLINVRTKLGELGDKKNLWKEIEFKRMILMDSTGFLYECSLPPHYDEDGSNTYMVYVLRSNLWDEEVASPMFLDYHENVSGLVYQSNKESTIDLRRLPDYESQWKEVGISELETEYYIYQSFQSVSHVTLEEFLDPMKKRWLSDVISVTYQLIDVVLFLHKHGLINRNLHPNKVFFDPATGRVQIWGFQHQLVLNRENFVVSVKDLLENSFGGESILKIGGHISYLPPELQDLEFDDSEKDCSEKEDEEEEEEGESPEKLTRKKKNRVEMIDYSKCDSYSVGVILSKMLFNVVSSTDFDFIILSMMKELCLKLVERDFSERIGILEAKALISQIVSIEKSINYKVARKKFGGNDDPNLVDEKKESYTPKTNEMNQEIQNTDEEKKDSYSRKLVHTVKISEGATGLGGKSFQILPPMATPTTPQPEKLSSEFKELTQKISDCSDIIASQLDSLKTTTECLNQLKKKLKQYEMTETKHQKLDVPDYLSESHSRSNYIKILLNEISKGKLERNPKNDFLDAFKKGVKEEGSKFGSHLSWILKYVGRLNELEIEHDQLSLLLNTKNWWELEKNFKPVSLRCSICRKIAKVNKRGFGKIVHDNCEGKTRSLETNRSIPLFEYYLKNRGEILEGEEGKEKEKKKTKMIRYPATWKSLFTGVGKDNQGNDVEITSGLVSRDYVIFFPKFV